MSTHPGGYAGVRLGDVRKPEPAEYEGDDTLEPFAQRTRINEAGDAVQGSQDSINRGVLAPSVHGPVGVRRKLGQRSHGTHEPATWWAGSQAGKHCSVATARSRIMFDMRCHPIAPSNCFQVDTATRHLVIGTYCQDRRHPCHKEHLSDGVDKSQNTRSATASSSWRPSG